MCIYTGTNIIDLAEKILFEGRQSFQGAHGTKKDQEISGTTEYPESTLTKVGTLCRTRQDTKGVIVIY